MIYIGCTIEWKWFLSVSVCNFIIVTAYTLISQTKTGIDTAIDYVEVFTVAETIAHPCSK